MKSDLNNTSYKELKKHIEFQEKLIFFSERDYNGCLALQEQAVRLRAEMEVMNKQLKELKKKKNKKAKKKT